MNISLTRSLSSYLSIYWVLCCVFILPHIQDLRKPTFIQKKDEVTSPDNQKIVTRSVVMDETSKEDFLGLKPVSHKATQYDGRHSPEIDNLKMADLEDSSKENIVSLKYLRTDEISSAEEYSKAYKIKGKIRNK